MIRPEASTRFEYRRIDKACLESLRTTAFRLVRSQSFNDAFGCGQTVAPDSRESRARLRRPSCAETSA